MGTETKTTITKDDLDPEVREYVDALEALVEDTITAVEKAGVKTIDELVSKVSDLESTIAAAGISKGDDDALKTALAKADPALRAILEKQASQLQAATEAISKAEAERFDAQIIAKAATVQAVATDDTVEVLKAAYTVSPEVGDKLLTVLKAAAEQVQAAAIWNELGGTGAVTTVTKSIDAAAEAIRKDHPEMSIEEARVEAMNANPALYDEAQKG